MPADDPFTGSLFPPSTGSTKDPYALYLRTIALFPTGSYQANPLNDPAGSGTGLGEWWAATWTALETALPPRKQLPKDAQQLDRNWVDGKVQEISDNIKGLESSQSTADRRGYANLALQKLAELQGELPLAALATAPKLSEAAATFRNACFTVAKGVVAQALNADRPAEGLQDTYRLLEFSDTAATHYWLGGDPPDSLEIPKGENPSSYLGAAAEGLDVPDPAGGQGNASTRFDNLLLTYGTAQNSVNGLRTIANRTAQQEQQLTAARGVLAKTVDDLANLTRDFARSTGELATKDPTDPAVVQSAELAMVMAEAMRNVTGVIRPDAQPGITDPLEPAQFKERAAAGVKAATELPGKLRERALEERAGPGA